MNTAALIVAAVLIAPAPSPLSVDVAASRSSVHTGGTVNFTIMVRDNEPSSTAATEVRIDQRVPSSLRYVWGTDGAVVSNTLVQWVVPIGPSRSGSVSATYTITSDPPSGEMKLLTTACTVPPGGGAATACQTTSLEVTDSAESARRSSMLGTGLGWSVAVLVLGFGAVLGAGIRRRYQRKSLLRRTNLHS